MELFVKWRRYGGPTWVCLLSLVLAGCFGPQLHPPTSSPQDLAAERRAQRDLAITTALAEYRRVERVYHALARHNDVLCPKLRRSIGVTLWSLHDFSEGAERESARALFGLDNRWRLRDVYEGTPADLAGLQINDEIIAVNDRVVPPTATGKHVLARALGATKFGNTIRLTLRRGAQIGHVSVPVEPICGYKIVYLFAAPEINAYADGKNVYVTRGMQNFARDDHELALVIGHEMGHDAMRHIPRIQANTALGALGGAALDVLLGTGGTEFSDVFAEYGQRSFSQDYEREADYIGLYMMARAGFPTDSAALFWRRMAIEVNPDSITMASSHPTAPERMLGLQRAHEEIIDKQRDNFELLPELQSPIQPLLIDDNSEEPDA